MRTLTFGILAHVDAGKTSLTERLLHHAGVIDEVGSVDRGSTQTDSLEMERRRGITIRSAVATFAIGDVTANLIDTPGHPDFIAEVERALAVLDGAVLVVSAVEGVQPQTRVLMRALRRLRVPTLLFVNKIDRTGARHGGLLRDLAEKLAVEVVPMGTTEALGTRAARFTPYGDDDPAFAAALTDALTRHDDALLGACVRGATPSYGRLRAALAEQTARAAVYPVFFGSAITGEGVAPVVTGIRDLLPSAEPDPAAPASGTVFKVDRGPGGERIAFVRLFAGTLRERDRLLLRRGATEVPGRVTGIGVFEHGADLRRAPLTAGRIGRLRGLGDVRIGDVIGAPRTAPAAFSPPTLETVVLARRRAERGALHAALARLAEQDPLINLRVDEVRQEVAVSLYGEVQKEVVRDTLAEEFGIEASFGATTTIHVERPAGTGAAVEMIYKEPNPFAATVGLRVEPAPPDSGVVYRLGVELGSMPLSFMKAVEETVRDTLRQGPKGWQVTDCVVTLTHSGFDSPITVAGDLRDLTPLVLAAALRRAGTRVCEPAHRFRIDMPSDAVGQVLARLAAFGALPEPATTRGGVSVVEGEIPASVVNDLERRLPGLTRGEGMLEYAFSHYRPVRGAEPSRPRTDNDPFERGAYLLRVRRRTNPRAVSAD